MEGVAAGAQTGKAAVYRRWPSKEDLVADALRAGLRQFRRHPGRRGCSRGLSVLCLRARDAMFSRPGLALRSVIHECDTAQAERFHGVIFEGVVEPTMKMSREVVDRGIERGEGRPEAANGYVFDAIPAMMMYRSRMCGCEWRDREVEEMIGQLMVPLLRPHGF